MPSAAPPPGRRKRPGEMRPGRTARFSAYFHRAMLPQPTIPMPISRSIGASLFFQNVRVMVSQGRLGSKWNILCNS